MKMRRSRSPFAAFSVIALLVAIQLVVTPQTGRAQQTEPTDGEVGSTPEVIEGTGEGTGAPTAAITSLVDEDRRSVVEAAFELNQAGDEAQAFERIERYLAFHPQDRTIAVLYSRLLSEQNDFEGAMRFLREHLEVHPESYNAALELGSILLAYLEYEDAISALERIPWVPNTTSTLARLNLGKAYRNAGRFLEARRVYESLTEGSSASFAQAALCELELTDGHLGECRSRLFDVGRNTSQHGALILVSAYLAYLEADYERAMNQVEAIRRIGDPGPRTMALMVLIPLAQGDAEAAEENFSELRRVTLKGERDALRALVQSAAGQQEQALASYRAAVERNSVFGNPALVGQILLWRSEVTEALTELATLSSAAPTEETSPQAASGETTESGGCCSVAGAPHAQPFLALLGAAVVALGWRRRQRS